MLTACSYGALVIRVREVHANSINIEIGNIVMIADQLKKMQCNPI